MNDETNTLRRTRRLDRPWSLEAEVARDVSDALNMLLADFAAVYLKTKNLRWRVSRTHLRDYQRILDAQADQICTTADRIVDRVRELGGSALPPIRHVGRFQCVPNNDAECVTPLETLAELGEDNGNLAARMREARALCDEYGDSPTASLLQLWVAEAEWRAWFLFEVTRPAETPETQVSLCHNLGR